MRILEVTEFDLFGRVFNGYDIMKQINRYTDNTVKMKVLRKVSADPDVVPFFGNFGVIDICGKMREGENSVLNMMSVLSLSSPALYASKDYKNADIVHYHQFHNSNLGFFELEREAKRKPTVISLHDPWMLTGRCVHPGECHRFAEGCGNCGYLNTHFPFARDMSAAMWKIKRDTFAAADPDIIVHSEYMYDLVKSNPYTKDLNVHLIPFGINVEDFALPVTRAESRDRFGIPRDDFVLFFRAQENFKGTEYIVEALKRFENTKGITLLTCSQIGLLDSIKDRYRVIELGNIKSETVKECFNACDVFLMPSICESFGLMALEAMAAGKPVVVFNNTALPWVTNAPDVGVLVNNLDSRDLYEKIKWLFDNKDERIRRGIEGRRLAKSRYSKEEYDKRILEVYESAYKRQKDKVAAASEAEPKVDIKNREVQKLLYHLEKAFSYTFGKGEKPIDMFNGAAALPCQSTEIDYENGEVRKAIIEFNRQCYKKAVSRRRSLKPKKDGYKMKVISNSGYETEFKMKGKKVSIIIPVYNGEDYMREAIDSALAQTYDNIEIIVVNDGSTDSTDEIAKSYGDKIVYLKKENGGVSTALNLAIEKMTGDYFSWLSHDDRYYPQKIEREMEFLEANGLFDEKVILYSDYDIMNSDSEVYLTAVKDHDELIKKPEYCLLRGAINGLTLLIPRSAFSECGNFRTDLRCVQDYVLWEKMMRAGYRYIHIPEVLVTTRIHENQQGNTSPVMVSEGEAFWTDLIKHTDEKRMCELEGSVYSFYKQMYEFMLTMPYPKALEYTENEYFKRRDEIIKSSENILVTVVIPFLNERAEVCNALKSVLEQSHKNIEILLPYIDTYNSIDNVEQAVKTAPNARIIKMSENSSFADACNTAIEAARGEYIAFLDPNDAFLPEKIRTQLLEMLADDGNFSHTNYLKNDIETGEKTEVDTSNLKGRSPTDLITDRRIAFSTAMFKTYFLRENRIGFKASFKLGGDLCFYLDCVKKTDVIAIGEPLSCVGLFSGYQSLSSSKLAALKTVLNYIFNDPEYAKYDDCLSRLSTEFISYYYDENVNEEILETLFGDFTNKKRGIIRRTLSAIKHRGVTATFKAGIGKIKRRLKKKK